MTNPVAIEPTSPKTKRWTNAAGAWLGIGTSPGTLILGAGIAQRYEGPIPLISILLSFVLSNRLQRFLHPDIYEEFLNETEEAIKREHECELEFKLNSEDVDFLKKNGIEF